jgi:hypothetical protein
MTMPFFNQRPLIVSLSLFAFAHPTFAQDLPSLEGNIVVDAKANIYSAGQTVPVAPAGGGAGILPPAISLPPTEKEKFISFPEITGQISCTNAEPPLYNDANGAKHCLGFTSAQSSQGFSGITYNKTMFLVGVFTSETQPPDLPPTSLNYNSIDEKTRTHPALNQIFLIGDGDYGEQQFQIPTQATQLFLGFVDGDETETVGFYDDNLGELSVDFAIYEIPIAPQLSQGLIAYYNFEESISYDGSSTHLADRSGFNFYGTLLDDPQVTFEPGKYQQAIVFQESAVINLMNPNYPGIPMNGNWTIASWFVYSGTTRFWYNFIISPRLITLGEKCRDVHVTVVNDELGTTGCNLFTKKFYGSGFLMSTLSEGWHHLAAVGNEGNTTFYIDGQQVGQSAYHSKIYIPFLGGNQLSLDDLRIYNRALSLSEIHILSETTPKESPITANDCNANYQNTGQLLIPCVIVPIPSEENPSLYEVEMELIQGINPMQFILTNVRPIQ